MTTRALFGDLLRRFDDTVAYVRSAFDDPVAAPTKASMARICALLALLGSLWTTRELVRFAFATPDKVGMAGILAGAAATLATGVVLGLLLRKRPDGSTQANDDERPPASSTTTVQTATVVSQAPAAPAPAEQ